MVTETNNGKDLFVRFVVATKKPYGTHLPIDSFLESVNLGKVRYCLDVHYDNNLGLPEVYNEEIEKSKKYDNDFTFFIHDDIWINDYLMLDKVISASKYFDVIGACGGKGWSKENMNLGQPINWVMASRSSGINGFMIHTIGTDENTKKHEMSYNGRTVFATSYGESPSRTLTIDGCFMCLTKKAIDAGLRFDESFKFHYYDMDLSFSAFSKHIKTGVAPVLLTHDSIGLSVRQPEFMESQKAFLKKWFAI